MSSGETTSSAGSLPPDLAWAAIDASLLGVVFTDAGLDEPSPRILYVNDAFVRLTGYSREACLGRSPRFLQGPDSSRLVLDRLREALQQGQSFEGETWNYRADGSPFLMHWTVAPVASGVTGERFFCAGQQDVTELRRLEALAETTNLMEGIGYVFSGIRHELGNPINSIKTALTLLRRGLERHSVERIAGTLDLVLEEVGRIEYLLHELRSFNALDPAVLVPVDLAAFLSRFVSLVKPECAARGCELVVQAEPSAPSHGFCDPRGLHQVLLNLVTNALDAMTTPSERVSYSAVDLPSIQEPRAPLLILRLRAGASGSWLLEVEDTGPGIAEHHVERIFDPFFTTKPNGTGLGLPLVKRVLARMGGALSVRSEFGRGATFVLAMPASPIVSTHG